MKKLLFFYFLLRGIGSVFSQNLDIASHGLDDNPKQVVSINSKCFYLEEFGDRLTGINSNGTVIFNAGMPGYSINTLYRLIKTKDNCLAVIGTGIGCETYNHLNNRNFIVKVDTNGAVKFQTLIQFFYPGQLMDQIIDFTQHTDSSYYIISDSLLYHYSKTGIFQSKINTGLKNMKTIISLNSGNLLINGRLNNIPKILEVIITASIVSQQNAQNAFVKFIQTPSGKIFGLTTLNTIESFNANLIFINTSSVNINPIYKFTDFTIKYDSLFITGTNTITNTPFYLIADQNFNTLFQTPTIYYCQNVNPVGIAIDNRTRVNIITKDLSTIQGPLSSMSHYQFPLNGNYNSQLDIGAIAFTVFNQSPINYGGSPETITFNLDVTVENFGSDTIKSFYLNHHGFITFTCQHVFLHKLYDTIIPPGGNVVVRTGDFYVDVSDGPPELCVFTTVPNKSTDMQVDNDAFCKPLSAIVGMNDVIAEDGILRVFPNPFTNHLNIESDFEITKIEIYNASGQSGSKFAVKNNKFSFDCSDLAAGIHLLKIDTEKGLQIRKVVKE